MERLGTVSARVVEGLRYTVDKKAGRVFSPPAKLREDETPKTGGKGRGESTADQCSGCAVAQIGGGYIGPDPPLADFRVDPFQQITEPMRE